MCCALFLLPSRRARPAGRLRLEIRADDDGGDDGSFHAQKKHFHEWVYFIIVTITTVGYGDISPVTTFGQVTTMLMLIFFVVLVPLQTNELLRLISSVSKYARKAYVPRSGQQHMCAA